MAEKGSSQELSLWENQSLVLLNSPAGNSPTEESNKTPVSSTVIAPPPPPPRPCLPSPPTWSKKRGRPTEDDDSSAKAKKGVSGEADDNHILTERERRKRMRDMFINLHALLPRLANKADKSTIVDEAVTYIRSLQSKLDTLEKRKQEREQGLGFFTTTDPSSSSHQTLIPYKTREAFLADQGSSNNGGFPVNSSSSSSRVPVGFQVWTSSNVILTICGEGAQFNICSPKKFGSLSAILYVLEKYKIDVVAATISSDAKRNIYMIQAQARSSIQDQLMEVFSVEDVYRKASEEIMQWIST